MMALSLFLTESLKFEITQIEYVITVSQPASTLTTFSHQKFPVGFCGIHDTIMHLQDLCSKSPLGNIIICRSFK